MDASEEPEKLKFFNFLKHYDLSQYHESFLRHGVRKVSHLKHTTDDDLREIGLQRPEIARLKKKTEENFSKLGKLKKRLSGKDHLFDGGVGYDTPTIPRKRGSTVSLGVVVYDSPILISSDQIQLLNKIGEGTHGAVYEADVILGGIQIRLAAKCVTATDEQSIQNQFMKEAESMVQLNHAHIIKLYGISIGKPLMMIEELATYGSLKNFLTTYSDKIHLAMMYTYVLQVANAMSYLEARKLIHRDLAARNVLVFSQDHVKLSDFGLARKLMENSEYQLTRLDVPLPTAWMSPESIEHRLFSTSSDVWSFGVFVWEVYTKGQKPWEGCKTVEIQDRLSTGDRLRKPALCPAQTYMMMNECWALEPRERPSFAELFKKLQEPQYRPQVALISTSHLVEGDLRLEKGDLLFVLDRPRGDLWVGMTTRGQEVSFLKDLVTSCDSMNIKKNPYDTEAIQLDTSSDQIFSSLRLLGLDQRAGINCAQNVDQAHVYETRENNPGADPDPYVKMNPSHHSILDTPTTPTTEHNLPPPIVPTAQALQDLVLSPTDTIPIYTDIDLQDDEMELNRNSVNVVESTYSVVEAANFTFNDTHSHTPPFLPPISPRTHYRPSPPHPHAHNPRPVPNNQNPVAESDSHAFKMPFGNGSSSTHEEPPFKLKQEETLLDTVLREFPDVETNVVESIVHRTEGDITRARKELKVHQLMEMGFSYIEEKDCIRALHHCQDKTERAAAWLLELSETISARKR